MSSSEGGMLPVCKNSVYASAYISCSAKSSLSWQKVLCCISNRTVLLVHRSSRIRRTVGKGNDHDLLALPVGLCT